MRKDDRVITLRIETGGLKAAEEDRLVNSLLAVVSKHGLKAASVEAPLRLQVETPWANTEEERCRSVKSKPVHAYTRTNAKRTSAGSSWRCGLRDGHSGMHQAYPDAHQSPWLD